MFQTACCLCNNEVEPVCVGTDSYASLILVELAPGCCSQKHVCRLNLSWWMFKRYEHVYIYIYIYTYTWPYVIYIYMSVYICLCMYNVCTNICSCRCSTDDPGWPKKSPTDCRRPQVPNGEVTTTRRFQNRWKKNYAVDLGKSTIYSWMVSKLFFFLGWIKQQKLGILVIYIYIPSDVIKHG